MPQQDGCPDPGSGWLGRRNLNPNTTMANTSLFPSRVGKAVPKSTTFNEAGGSAYAFSEKHALAQYTVTGCLNTTFYASAETQLSQALKLANAVEPEFVAKAAIYARNRSYMKDMPALLCATLAVRDAKLLGRVFDRVIDNGKMLRNFVQIVRSGVVGRKSLGTAPKRLVQRWFEQRDDDQVFRDSVGQTPSLADVIKMVHPRPGTASREALYGWLLGRPHQAKALPSLVCKYEAFKRGELSVAPDVPFQMLTALELDSTAWLTIAAKASWQTTRMNLNTFLRHGVFKNKGAVRQIAGRLRDPEAIRRARCFPYQMLTAFHTLNQQVPREVREALHDAMETAIQNVPIIQGRVVVCADVSGSMQSPVTGHRPGATTATRCVDVASLVAAAVLRRNAKAHVIAFSDDVVPCRLKSSDRVMTNAKKLADLPSGGTDCSGPLRYLNRESARGDLVILVSDNMSWMNCRGGGQGTETMFQWERFRARNPRARLVCLDLQPYGSSQAVERQDILNIGGFSDAVFEIIAAFAAGELNADHWVGLIEQTALP
jgi:60 kDa SS-A/Ro ribonucleoprotein